MRNVLRFRFSRLIPQNSKVPYQIASMAATIDLLRLFFFTVFSGVLESKVERQGYSSLLAHQSVEQFSGPAGQGAVRAPVWSYMATSDDMSSPVLSSKRRACAKQAFVLLLSVSP